MFIGGTGFFIDKSTPPAAKEFSGCMGKGAMSSSEYWRQVSKLTLNPEGGCTRDPPVRMETNVQRLSTGLLAGVNLVTNRFTGPGRLGIQFMYVHLASE